MNYLKKLLTVCVAFSFFLSSSASLWAQTYAGGRTAYRVVYPNNKKSSWYSARITINAGQISIYNSSGKLVSRFQAETAQKRRGGERKKYTSMEVAAVTIGLAIFGFLAIHKAVGEGIQAKRDAANAEYNKCMETKDWIDCVHQRNDPVSLEADEGAVLAYTGGFALFPLAWKIAQREKVEPHISLSNSIEGHSNVDIRLEDSARNNFLRNTSNDATRPDRFSLGIYPQTDGVFAKIRMRF